MDQGTTHVALDDSKRKLAVAILRPGQTEPELVGGSPINMEPPSPERT